MIRPIRQIFLGQAPFTPLKRIENNPGKRATPASVPSRDRLLAGASRLRQRPILQAFTILPVSVPGGALGRGVVENNQTVDGNPGPGIDQKWIDVDRRNPGAGV